MYYDKRRDYTIKEKNLIDCANYLLRRVNEQNQIRIKMFEPRNKTSVKELLAGDEKLSILVDFLKNNNNGHVIDWNNVDVVLNKVANYFRVINHNLQHSTVCGDSLYLWNLSHESNEYHVIDVDVLSKEEYKKSGLTPILKCLFGFIASTNMCNTATEYANYWYEDELELHDITKRDLESFDPIPDFVVAFVQDWKNIKHLINVAEIPDLIKVMLYELVEQFQYLIDIKFNVGWYRPYYRFDVDKNEDIGSIYGYLDISETVIFYQESKPAIINAMHEMLDSNYGEGFGAKIYNYTIINAQGLKRMNANIDALNKYYKALHHYHFIKDLLYEHFK